MGCSKSKKVSPEEFYCAFHKKTLADYFCLLPSCTTCSKDKFSLCHSCNDDHKKTLNGLEHLYLQPIGNVNMNKIKFNRHFFPKSQIEIQKNIDVLQHALSEIQQKQISLKEYSEKIYEPLQKLTNFSIIEKEKEKEKDYEMLNHHQLFIGSINCDGKVLNEAHTITHFFSDFDCSIKDEKNKQIIAYYYDTGLFKDSLNKIIGSIELDEEGASVFDFRRLKIGSISNQGQVFNINSEILGSCQANKIKVAYEYFFHNNFALKN